MGRKTPSKPRAWVWANIHCNVYCEQSTHCQGKGHCLKSCFVGGVDRADLVKASSSLPDFAEAEQRKPHRMSWAETSGTSSRRARPSEQRKPHRSTAETSGMSSRRVRPSKQKNRLPQRKSSEPGFARAETPCANTGTRVCGTAVEPNIVSGSKCLSGFGKSYAFTTIVPGNKYAPRAEARRVWTRAVRKKRQEGTLVKLQAKLRGTKKLRASRELGYGQTSTVTCRLLTTVSFCSSRHIVRA